MVILLEELLRREILALLESGEWTERTLAAALDKSQGALQGWTRNARPSKPGLDVLEGVARLKGVSVEQLVAELYGRAYAPTGDRTWAEIGAEMSNEEFKELVQGLEVYQIATWMKVLSETLTNRCQDRK